MENAIITYGLNEEQVSLLETAVQNSCQVSSVDCLTDLIVTTAFCAVIDVQTLSEDGLRALLAYYMDMGERLDETVVWIGKIDLPDLPSFVRCEDFLQLLLNCREIVTQAKSRYDTMQQYTDLYSYLPRHAIAECLEADVWAAFQKMAKIYPDFYTREDFREEWMKVSNTENGAELLASVYEFCRWLKMRRIPYRLESVCFDLLDWIMGIMDSVSFTDHGEAYTVCILQEHLNIVENWLKNHWYFQKPDERLRLKTVEGLETGIASLDLQIMGMRPGEVILVGGRPAMGKTSFARGVERHLTEQGKRVFYFDFVHDRKEAHKDFVEFDSELRASNADLAVFDHFQFLNDYDETDETAAHLFEKIKSLATELCIPIMVLLHLNRNPETRPDPSPIESDIPHSKKILPCIDTVLLLYRRAYYDPVVNRRSARCVILKAKRCKYKYKTLTLKWDDENYRFTD